jgi:hypothetical protein
MTELHVALLRRLAAGERIPPEWMRPGAPPELDDLLTHGLTRWDGAASSDVVTPAGRAALLFFELGRGGA